MWLRLTGLLAAALAVMVALDLSGAAGGDGPDLAGAAHGRWRELFWLAAFAFMMATAVWIAARRQALRLRAAVVRRR